MSNSLFSEGPRRRYKNALAVDRSEQWGNRYGTNTPKGEGWLGLLKRPAGGLSTELSVGVQFDGKETEIPLIVPTLSADEVRYLLNNDPQSPQFHADMPKSILRKAVDHAASRMRMGRSPFMD